MVGWKVVKVVGWKVVGWWDGRWWDGGMVRCKMMGWSEGK